MKTIEDRKSYRVEINFEKNLYVRRDLGEIYDTRISPLVPDSDTSFSDSSYVDWNQLQEFITGSLPRPRSRHINEAI